MGKVRQNRPFAGTSIMSALLLAGLISGASLASQPAKSAKGHNFVGTMPNPTVIAQQTATF